MPVAKPTFTSRGVAATTKKEKKKLIDDAIRAMAKRSSSKSSGKLAGADRARPRRK